MTTNGLVVASAHVPGREATTYINHSLGGSIELATGFSIAAGGGETFVRAKAELDCVIPPVGPNLALGWSNVSVMTWPPEDMSDHIGLNTHLSSVDHNGTNVSWNRTEPSPSVMMENSTLRLSYRTLEPAGSAANALPPVVMLSVANLTPTTAVRINGAVQTLSEGLSVLSHRAAASCPAPSASTVHPTFMVLARTCTLESRFRAQPMSRCCSSCTSCPTPRSACASTLLP